MEPKRSLSWSQNPSWYTRAWNVITVITVFREQYCKTSGSHCSVAENSDLLQCEALSLSELFLCITALYIYIYIYIYVLLTHTNLFCSAEFSRCKSWFSVFVLLHDQPRLKLKTINKLLSISCVYSQCFTWQVTVLFSFYLLSVCLRF
jgi:hypothetical protein